MSHSSQCPTSSPIDENNKIMTKKPPPTRDNFRIFTSSFPLFHLRCVFFLLLRQPTSTQQWFDCVKEKCRKLLSFPHCWWSHSFLTAFDVLHTVKRKKEDFSRTLSPSLKMTASARPQCYQWVSSEKLLFIVFHLIKSISAQLIRYIFHKAEKKMFHQPQWIQVSGNDTEKRRVDEAKRESFLFSAHTSELFVSVKVCRWSSSRPFWNNWIKNLDYHLYSKCLVITERVMKRLSVSLRFSSAVVEVSERVEENLWIFRTLFFYFFCDFFPFQCSDTQWCVL